jgi:hypothetical protein
LPDPSFLSIASENSSTGEDWKHPILKKSSKIDNPSAQNTHTTPCSCVENTGPQKSALLLSRNLSNEHTDADNIHPKKKRLIRLFLNRMWGQKK